MLADKPDKWASYEVPAAKAAPKTDRWAQYEAAPAAATD